MKLKIPVFVYSIIISFLLSTNSLKAQTFQWIKDGGSAENLGNDKEAVCKSSAKSGLI